MILSRLKITLLSMAALLLCVATADAQKKNNVSLKKATAWTEAGEWRNGFDAMPDKTVNLQEFYSQYHKNKAQWDAAFKWLAETDLLNIPNEHQSICRGQQQRTAGEAPLGVAQKED